MHWGRSDEEIIEKGPLPSERGRQGSAAYEMQRRCRRLKMISTKELAAFPAKFPIHRRGGRKAILMAKKDIRIRKMRVGGHHNTTVPNNFLSTIYPVFQV